MVTIATLPIQIQSPGSSAGDLVELDVSAFWLARGDRLQRKYVDDSSIFEMVNINGKRIVCTYGEAVAVIEENDLALLDKIEAKVLFTMLNLSGVMSRADVTTLQATLAAHWTSLDAEYHVLRTQLADPDISAETISTLGAKYEDGVLFTTTQIAAVVAGVSFSGYVLSPDSFNVNYWLEGQYADVTINLHCVD